MIEYNIRDGIPKDVDVREGFYTLHYSQHAKKRFTERAGNDPVFPKIVNVINGKNVVIVKADESMPKVAAELVIRLQYKKYVRLFMVIVPYDNGTALVKTLWFKEKTKRNEKRTSNWSGCVSKYPLPPKECLVPGTEKTV